MYGRAMSGWDRESMGIPPPSPADIQIAQREAASQAQAQIHAGATAKHVAEVTPGTIDEKRAAADAAYRAAYQTQLTRSREAYGLDAGGARMLWIAAGLGLGAYFLLRK